MELEGLDKNLNVVWNPLPSVVRKFAQHIRGMDLLEQTMLTGSSLTYFDVENQLMDGVFKAELGWAVFWKEVPMCVGGVQVTESASVYLVWQVGTRMCELKPLAYTHFSIAGMEMLLEEFGTLTNWCLDENKSTQRWLQHCGFSFDADPVEVEGVKWWRFYKTIGSEADICAGQMSEAISLRH